MTDRWQDDRWSDVDARLERAVLHDDAALQSALDTSDAEGLPPIAVTPLQGKLLHLLARLQGARRVLEIGTLGGYSTTWLARALPPGGEVVTLELDPHHAEVARRNLDRAGVGDRVRVVVGPALETLEQLEGPFDLVFVDADKQSSVAYLERALELSRAGSLLVFDNVIRGGAVAGGSSGDPRVAGVRALLERLGRDPRLRASALQTVGAKGHDGFALAVVL
jgi:predicted O-methyltransferase YrrM